MLSRHIRQSFIDFYAGRGHAAVASSPLVPRDDPTLLFVNAGMVQFKNYFLGVEQPESPRAVTSQKCLRVSGKHNDLENVGPSPRHHTFFEMLGNFSFGDYFKEEAIASAWELVTGPWGLRPEHLFATVFEQDDEAEDLWLRISGLPPERVLRCGEKDNFWAMGDTGPCGPCSEIFVDTAPDLPEVGWDEGEGSGRYLEIWNLVFMQFERHEDGRSELLPNPSIDTGAGLERVAAVLQGVDSNYDTDLFGTILTAVAGAAGSEYGRDPEADVSMRVVADHLRAVGFLLADGVLPSNEGRGYVLRRLLRRASRHGMKLGLEEPFMASLLPSLEEAFAGHYPELEKAREPSAATITAEETRFLETVAVGAGKVQQAIEEARAEGGSALVGEQVFRLYDTFGLPIETVREIAEEEQFTIDEEGFEAALAEQRERSRRATATVMPARVEFSISSPRAGRDFTGYDDLEADSRAVAVASAEGAPVREVRDTGFAVFERTPFYAEAGGQVGDVGFVEWDGGKARVVDTFHDGGRIVHRIDVVGGALEEGAAVELQVDREKREAAQRHHTATHLLHAALRQHLGTGVRQAGSLVHPDRLRFDFTHGAPVNEEQQEAIEDTVNEWVRRAVPLEIGERSYDEAVAAGAMALFGEKYGDRVRTVEVPGFSLELCGGCHVGNTGEIGPVALVGERGVAAGVRRIEALAGDRADRLRRSQLHLLTSLEREIGASGEQAAAEVRALKDRLRDIERELSQLRLGVLAGDGKPASGQDAAGDTRSIRGVDVVLREVPASNVGELRNLADVLRGRLGSGVVVLGALDDGKAKLVASVTRDVQDRIDAAAVARAMGSAISGSGGGRRDFAQAGGRAENLTSAFAAAEQLIEDCLS
ncbi:MAG: alanine--tRNA ligase [Holophagales bacterium]|nr:alanine--tRNA ligase [Holophagales bacterium]MYG30680.1 alanine--tRNA ligase [Holophagales bacterium]MYI81620.1 alanine--tRNA ligase [Holophagales bacterium]